jgi:hypothetical protein
MDRRILERLSSQCPEFRYRMPAESLNTLERAPVETVLQPATRDQQSSFLTWFSYLASPWVLAILGIALRLRQYLFNRSLWLDEAMMAINITHRSFSELTKTMEYYLVAPWFWLFTEKASNLLFGNHELPLRLPVFLWGSAAMLLLIPLAKLIFSPRAVPIAVAFFALSPALIYYSSELKPYGSDPGVACLVWLTGAWLIHRGPSPWRLVLLALCGALAPWFSHPAIFVLAAVAVAIVWQCLAAHHWHRLAAYSPAFFLWIASFALNYALAIRVRSHDPHLTASYPFLGFPPVRHFADVENILQTVFLLQQNTASLLMGVAVFAAIVGCLYYWRRDRITLCLLLSPLLFALAASSLHLYPIVGRFYCFFAPALAILVAAGAYQLWMATHSSAMPVGAALLVVLFLQPVDACLRIARHPMQTHELRPVLKYVQQHAKPGDVWYIYTYAQPAYRYYSEAYGLKGDYVVFGSSFRNGIVNRIFQHNWEFFQNDFTKLRGKRVWLIFSHNWAGDGINEQVYGLQVADRNGRREDTYQQTDAAAFLYEFNSPPLELTARP